MSCTTHARIGPDVRMNVKLSRCEFPLLTDDIARLPKGPRRTNRLTHLATLGLCWERALAGLETWSLEVRHDTAPMRIDSAVPAGSTAQPYRSRLNVGQLAALFEDGGS